MTRHAYFYFRMRSCWMFLLLVGVAAGCEEEKAAEEGPHQQWRYRATLDRLGEFVLLWTPHDDTIDFQVEVSKLQNVLVSNKTSDQFYNHSIAAV